MPSIAARCITVPMSAWRRSLVGGFAALLIGGHAYDTIVQREHWPFSYYQMYSRVQAKSRLDLLGLYGVMRDGNRTRLEQIVSENYLPPLQEVHLRNILMTAWGRDGTAPNAQRNTAKILGDYLHAYEGRRVAGLHHGPPMVEARLCIATYLLKGGGDKQKAPQIQPLLGVTHDGATRNYANAATLPAAQAEDETDVHP